MKMTREERKAEFDRLFQSIEANNKTRVKTVVKILHCKPGTVHIWCMDNPPRVIPENSLKVLSDGIARMKESNQ